MTDTARPPRPRFIGVDTYCDPHGRFTFRYPTDWHRFELDNGLEGVLFSPEREDPKTFFAYRRQVWRCAEEDLQQQLGHHRFHPRDAVWLVAAALAQGWTGDRPRFC
jgi:uncharacterized protein YndB with AHSA1/START domain